MSYALALNERTRRQIRELEVWLQEEVFDELDELARDPSRLVYRTTSPGAVYDFIRRRGDSVHYVFLTVDRDDAAQLLQVLDVGHLSRRAED